MNSDLTPTSDDSEHDPIPVVTATTALDIRDSWPVRVVIGTFSAVTILLIIIVGWQVIRGLPVDQDAKELLLASFGFLGGVLAKTSRSR